MKIRARDADLARGPRDGLTVVACARGDDARRRSSSLSVEIRLYAPRTLNEPVRWRFSAFRYTSRPASCESVSER